MSDNSFWPKDTETTKYICGSISFTDLILRIREFWPNAAIIMDNFEISTEYIQTSCIGYDLYDASDYTSFIVITKK